MKMLVTHVKICYHFTFQQKYFFPICSNCCNQSPASSSNKVVKRQRADDSLIRLHVILIPVRVLCLRVDHPSSICVPPYQFSGSGGARERKTDVSLLEEERPELQGNYI